VEEKDRGKNTANCYESKKKQAFFSAFGHLPETVAGLPNEHRKTKQKEKLIF